MTEVKPGVEYKLSDGQSVRFIECVGGVRIAEGGTTNEELIEVVIARLRHQNRLLSCRENSLAITALEEADNWLHRRDRRIRAEKDHDLRHPNVPK